ncbi:MAG: tRNA (N6-threonylcarbamoyladenosine(37)-N6)-methyltransferase TrmO [Actinomycetota bacterium]
MAEQQQDRAEFEKNMKKLRALMPYWLSHNEQHILDNEKWLGIIEEMGLEEVARELKEAIDMLKEANGHIALANEELKGAEAGEPGDMPAKRPPKKGVEAKTSPEGRSFEFQQIGVVRTPYTDNAPYQPVEDEEMDFRIVLERRYADGLYKLDGFNYIYVIYYVHRVRREPSMIVSPPWTGGREVGVFASRSPVRPNYIGLSVVRLKGIEDNEILTSGLDVFDGTPVIDIKPYIKDLDTKLDANYGWIAEMHDFEHLLLHIKGIPHDY